MEENKVMETMNEVTENINVPEVAEIELPVEAKVTEIPQVEVPETIGIGKVVAVTAIAAAAAYGVYVVGKKAVKKFKDWRAEKKYIKAGGHSDDDFDDEFEDEDLEEVSAEDIVNPEKEA